MSDYIDRTAEILDIHEIVFIDHEVGYDCGCNEYGDSFPKGLRFQSDALRHQAEALDSAELLASPSHDMAVYVRELRAEADAAEELGVKAIPISWLRARADHIERVGQHDR